jgi:23S rRNA (adenine2030-N6)-methyltransferase
MFSYIHRYHAGSFSDVHKHLVLTAILLQLRKKETPFCVLDTHAGEGFYDIHSPESQKTTEFTLGFRKLLDLENPPELIQTYLEVIQACNPGTSKHIYPGSPGITEHFLRANDRALCVEGHPQAIEQLRQNFKRNSSVHIHNRDSLEALVGLVPFKEKRGLIFIDPSYEVKTEYKTLAKTLLSAYEKFPQGIYAIWYPLLEANNHIDMLSVIQRSSLTKVWYCEWFHYPSENKKIQGSGMVIVNMPWQMDKLLNETFAWLNRNVFKQGTFKQGWI